IVRLRTNGRCIRRRELFSVTELGLAVFVKLVASPEQAADDEIEIDVALNRLIAMAENSAENAAFAINIHPNAKMSVGFIFRREALRQRSAIGPDLFDLVKFVRVVFPGGGKAFHDRMVGLERNNGERAPDLMTK